MSSQAQEPPVKKDILILVLGAAGAGKSYFINTILKTEKMVVGKDLDSCTKELDFGYIDEIEGHPSLNNHRIVLVDTPGFDDTDREDLETLEKIVVWLKSRIHQDGEKLGGIVYVHDISEVRFTNTARQNVKLLQNMCGDDVLKNIIFATTKWDRKNNYAEEHQRELETIYWNSLIKKGAQAHRVDHGYESAWAIVNIIISIVEKQEHGTSLQIKKEVQEGKTTPETRAGESLKRTPTRNLKGILRRFTTFFRNTHNWFF